jgi:hypothetical protein
MYFSSMIDMAKTPEQVKEETVPSKGVALGERPPTTPIYPWGLCIRLEDDTLVKLKLDGELPEVGEMIHLCAMAKVTSVRESEEETADGSKRTNRCIELQITHLATENEDDENDEAIEKQKARQGRFYGPDAA